MYYCLYHYVISLHHLVADTVLFNQTITEQAWYTCECKEKIGNLLGFNTNIKCYAPLRTNGHSCCTWSRGSQKHQVQCALWRRLRIIIWGQTHVTGLHLSPSPAASRSQIDVQTTAEINHDRCNLKTANQHTQQFCGGDSVRAGLWHSSRC